MVVNKCSVSSIQLLANISPFCPIDTIKKVTMNMGDKQNTKEVVLRRNMNESDSNKFT